MLKRYKEILDKARTAKLETLTTWYSLFRMKEDPFLSQIPPEEIDYFVNRENIVDAIIYDVGVASRGIPINILLIGPHGSGKTATLQYIANVLKKLKQEYPGEYTFNGEFFPAEYLFQKPEPEEDEVIEDVQPWIKKSREKRDFLFIDDVKPKHAETIMREFVQTRLKVFAISPLDFEEIYSNFPVTPKIYYLRPIDLKNTIQMLDKRIKRVLVDERYRITILDLFEEEALHILHKYGMGIPGLILKCASKSLNLLLDMYYQDITAITEAKKQKVTTKIAIRACKITKCFQAYTEFEKLTRTKKEVLQQVIRGPKTPTEISLILKKDRTTISRHLSDLKERGLVKFKSRGRESMYEATEPTKIRLELELMPNGGGKFAST